MYALIKTEERHTYYTVQAYANNADQLVGEVKKLRVRTEILSSCIFVSEFHVNFD